MMCLSLFPQNQWKIKCFVRHYSNYYFDDSKQKINNIIK